MIDVAIIGAGPVGLACGVAARRNDLSSVVLEKGALVNSLLGYPTNMEFFSTPELLEIGGYPLATLRYKPVREEVIDYYRRVAAAESLDLRLYERVIHVRGEADSFVVETERGEYGCRRIVVATGFFDLPNLLNVPGEDLPKVSHYYKEPFAYTGQNLAIVGAKNSAAKAALDCYRHGARVTLIVRSAALSESIKYWIRPDLDNRIKEGSIRALFDTTVVEIREKSLVLSSPGGQIEIENDWVLAMTGYRPSYRLFKLLGIEVQDDVARTPVYDPDTFESNRNGIYLAGTVCGGLNTSRWFIENGRFHAHVIMEQIARSRTWAATVE
jgi:thioredoxin reductase (NADPH)